MILARLVHGSIDRSSVFSFALLSAYLLPLARPRRSVRPSRYDVGRTRRELRTVLRTCDKGGALLVRRAWRLGARADRAPGIHRRGLARLSAGCPAGSDLWLSGPRPFRAQGGSSVQSQQAAPRSLCEADRRRGAMASVTLRLCARLARQGPLIRRAS